MTRNISTSHATNFKLVFPYLSFLSDDTNFEKGLDVVLYCKAVNLPSPQMEVVETATPFFMQKEPSNIIQYTELVVDFALSEKMENYKFIYDWMMAIKNPVEFGIHNDKKIQSTLHILSNKNNPKAKVTFMGLFPIGLSEIPFTYTEEEDMDLVVTATFALNYFTVEN
jgi:hypothetical protein